MSSSQSSSACASSLGRGWAEAGKAGLLVAGERLLILHHEAVPATVVDEVVVGHPGEVGPQVLAVAELPAFVAEALEHVGPGRLHDVHRVELGPHPRRQPPPHHDAEDRLEGLVDFSRGVHLTPGQPLEQTVESVVHGSSGLEPPGRPEIPSREVAMSTAASSSSSGSAPGSWEPPSRRSGQRPPPAARQPRPSAPEATTARRPGLRAAGGTGRWSVPRRPDRTA